MRPLPVCRALQATKARFKNVQPSNQPAKPWRAVLVARQGDPRPPKSMGIFTTAAQVGAHRACLPTCMEACNRRAAGRPAACRRPCVAAVTAAAGRSPCRTPLSWLRCRLQQRRTFQWSGGRRCGAASGARASRCSTFLAPGERAARWGAGFEEAGRVHCGEQTSTNWRMRTSTDLQPFLGAPPTHVLHSDLSRQLHLAALPVRLLNPRAATKSPWRRGAACTPQTARQTCASCSRSFATAVCCSRWQSASWQRQRQQAQPSLVRARSLAVQRPQIVAWDGCPSRRRRRAGRLRSVGGRGPGRRASPADRTAGRPCLPLPPPRQQERFPGWARPNPASG